MSAYQDKRRIREILKFCAELSEAEKYDEQEECYCWTVDLDGQIPRLVKSGGAKISTGRCTNGAAIVAAVFGGAVAGYRLEGAQEARLVGLNALGHDFAVTDDLIVDWWGWAVECSLDSPVIPIDRAIADGKHLPRDRWAVNQPGEWLAHYRGGPGCAT